MVLRNLTFGLYFSCQKHDIYSNINFVGVVSGLLWRMQGVGSQNGDVWKPMSCLDSKATCAVDSHCQMMLSAIPDICPPTDECDLKKRQDCQAVQRWLQLTPVFRDCHCNLNGGLREQCQTLKASIYTDPCPHVVTGVC